jgi:hypothetical protein
LGCVIERGTIKMKHRFVNGLAVAAALVIILGVGSAAKTAFANPANLSLNSGASTSQTK